MNITSFRFPTLVCCKNAVMRVAPSRWPPLQRLFFSGQTLYMRSDPLLSHVLPPAIAIPLEACTVTGSGHGVM